MIESLTEILNFTELTWTEVLLGLVVFVIASVGGLLIARFLLVKLPAMYFCESYPRDLWVDRHPLIRWTGLILKNLVGVFVVLVGVILSMPGVPGPGFLVILIGVLLLDFPGKRRLERWLLSRPRALDSVNRLRQRHGKPPLVLGPESHSIPQYQRDDRSHPGRLNCPGPTVMLRTPDWNRALTRHAATD